MHRWLTHPKVSRLNQERAWEMRQNMSPAEQKLWRELSGGKLGVAVRRQAVVGRYILDFLVPSKRLAIEVDGQHHARRRAADARRNRVLTRLGYRVLRIEAELVHRALPQAVSRVVAALEAAW